MKRSMTLSLALLMVSAIMAPAYSARPPARRLVHDCKESKAMFPITVEEAQAMLPPGFEPSQHPNGNINNITYLWIVASICGDEDAPDLKRVVTYIAVDPPKEHHADGSLHHYIVDAVATGPSAAALEDHLCTEDLFEEGTVSSSQIPLDPGLDNGPAGLDPAGIVSYSYVLSDSLDAQIVLDAASPAKLSDDFVAYRWFYKDGEQIRSFDTWILATMAMTGTSTVTFGAATEYAVPTEPKGAGLGQFVALDETFHRPQDCRTQKK